MFSFCLISIDICSFIILIATNILKLVLYDTWREMKLVFLHDSFLVIKHELTDIYILKTTLVFELVQMFNRTFEKCIRSRKANFSLHIVDKDILGCPSLAGCRETLVFHILRILYFHTWGSIDLQLLIPSTHKGIRSRGHFFGPYSAILKICHFRI